MSHEPTTNDTQIPDRLGSALQAALTEPTPGDPAPSAALRAVLAARLNELSSQSHSSAEVTPMNTSNKSSWARVAATLIASGVAAGIAISLFMPATQSARESVRRTKYEDQLALVTQDGEKLENLQRMQAAQERTYNGKSFDEFTITGSKTSETLGNHDGSKRTDGAFSPIPGIGFNPAQQGQQSANYPFAPGEKKGDQAASASTLSGVMQQQQANISKYSGGYAAPGNQSAPVSGPAGGTSRGGAATTLAPAADPFAAASTGTPMPLIKNPEPQKTGASSLALRVDAGGQTLPSATYLTDDIQYQPMDRKYKLANEAGKLKELAEGENLRRKQAQGGEWREQAVGEQYEQRVENIFQSVRAEPLSTFSIDVDTASYTNCRRFLEGRQLPPTAAVRVEEFINYFRYDYPQPTGKDPFSVNMEMADCPWTPNHKLLRVGLKGKEIDRRERPESNLVFLVDVSGSMSSEDKLPLLRDAMHRWVNELSANDRVTIVTYAGDAGLRLPTTRGDQKDKLHAAIETLQSGGSTHGSAGIKLAYEQATANFLEDGGVNRVLWATDGDLNVGTTSDDELVELITNKAKTGVFLTVLGVGTGNLKDAKLEKMADKGNGVYAYLDSPKEARKVLIEQMSGTTITIAKDVKIQIEFNPAEIAGYRLIGYENRMLAAEDFANDKKDAGEIGAGHTVTALYEIIPVGAAEQGNGPVKEPLKYQAAEVASGATAAQVKLSDAAKSGELLTLKLRFKQPDAHKSELREFPLTERGGKFTAASKDFQFAGCVAQLAMILRDSQYRGEMTTAAIAEIAAATKGEDKDGSRAEFVELVKRVQELGK